MLCVWKQLFAILLTFGFTYRSWIVILYSVYIQQVQNKIEDYQYFFYTKTLWPCLAESSEPTIRDCKGNIELWSLMSTKFMWQQWYGYVFPSALSWRYCCLECQFEQKKCDIKLARYAVMMTRVLLMTACTELCDNFTSYKQTESNLRP